MVPWYIKWSIIVVYEKNWMVCWLASILPAMAKMMRMFYGQQTIMVCWNSDSIVTVTTKGRCLCFNYRESNCCQAPDKSKNSFFAYSFIHSSFPWVLVFLKNGYPKTKVQDTELLCSNFIILNLQYLWSALELGIKVICHKYV